MFWPDYTFILKFFQRNLNPKSWAVGWIWETNEALFMTEIIKVIIVKIKVEGFEKAIWFGFKFGKRRIR